MEQNSVRNPFTKHPKSVGETYLQHLKIAILGSLRLGTSSMLFAIHGVFTFLPVPKPFDLESTTKWLNDIEGKRKQNEKVSNEIL